MTCQSSDVSRQDAVCVLSPASRKAPPPCPSLPATPPPTFMPPACSPIADESMAKQNKTCTRRSKRARMQCAGAKELVQKEDGPARIGRSRGESQRHLVGGHCPQLRLHPACERRADTYRQARDTYTQARYTYEQARVESRQECSMTRTHRCGSSHPHVDAPP